MFEAYTCLLFENNSELIVPSVDETLSLVKGTSEPDFETSVVDDLIGEVFEESLEYDDSSGESDSDSDDVPDSRASNILTII